MNQKRILIVDDEPRSRTGLKRTLEASSSALYNIKTSASAFEAMEILETCTIDLLITDIRMPEMTGLNLIGKLKNLEYKPEFIVISAYSEFNYAHEALELDVITYLLKPVPKDKLLAAVNKALKTREEKNRYHQVEKLLNPKLDSVRWQSSGFPDAVASAIAYVDNHFHEKLGIKDVAKAVHLTPGYFSALFKEQTNMTFSEYLMRRRLQYAKHLLLSTNLPVSDIAEKSGYRTAKYFIKLFKENEHMTPSKYRKEDKNSTHSN